MTQLTFLSYANYWSIAMSEVTASVECPKDQIPRLHAARHGNSYPSAIGAVCIDVVLRPTSPSASGTMICTNDEETVIVTITASEARKNLFPLIEQVNDDRQPIEITSRRGDAVLVSRADWDALNETAMLLRVPANAQWLIESLAQARAGLREEHSLDRS